MEASKVVYEGIAQEMGNVVLRNDLLYWGTVVDVYGLALGYELNWGPGALHDVGLAYQLLYNATGDNAIAMRYAMLFNLQFVCAWEPRSNWRITQQDILDWLSQYESSKEPQQPAKRVTEQEMFAAFARRKEPGKDEQGNTGNASKDSAGITGGSGGDNPAPKRELPTATLEPVGLPAGRDQGKASQDGQVKRKAP